MRARTAAVLAVALASAMPCAAQVADWLPAWGSAQMRVEGATAEPLAQAGAVTIRQTVRVSLGGGTIRVRLSNVAGTAPLRIGAATVAAGRPGQARIAAPLALRFAGSAATVIPAGAEVYSDPLPMRVAAGGDLTVSLYFPDPVAVRTGHPGARATSFVYPGNVAAAPDPAEGRRIGGWWSLADIEVLPARHSAAIVAIGDSITDGYGIVENSNTRWPDLLARRLAAGPRTRRFAVVNAGIGGNRVLLDGLGPSLMARFDRDVVARPGVTHAIVLEGVNDLGVLTRDGAMPAAEHDAIVAAITDAYRQLAARARAHGIRVIGGTITPFAGSDYYHPGPATEADRQAINRFIRTGGVFDAVIDFDRVLRDPAHPDRLLPAYDSGDHLHPSPAGYRAMAEAVPLSLFSAR